MRPPPRQTSQTAAAPARTETNIHASAVLIGERGVLIRGTAGSGKSSLVLRLLDRDPATTWLVADDRVIVAAHHGHLVATVPPAIAGLLEIRGHGIVSRPYVSPVLIGLVVSLRPPGDCPRLPEPDAATTNLAGIALPLLTLPIGDPAGAERVRAVVADPARGIVN